MRRRLRFHVTLEDRHFSLCVRTHRASRGKAFPPPPPRGIWLKRLVRAMCRNRRVWGGDKMACLERRKVKAPCDLTVLGKLCAGPTGHVCAVGKKNDRDKLPRGGRILEMSEWVGKREGKMHTTVPIMNCTLMRTITLIIAVKPN